MPMTPTKKKTPAPPQPDFKVVDKLRRDWLALLPPDMDTSKWVAADLEEGLALLWNVAGCARQFMEWTHFMPAEWEAPSGYTSRLARTCAWLRQQERGDLPYRREDALNILLNAWPRHLAHMRDDELLFYTIPTLWNPDDEFGPLDAPLPYLPVWEVSLTPGREEELGPERVGAMREAARVAEEFCLYAGLVTYLNTQVGLPLLDLALNPF